ncbi:MAG: type II secretion system protein GspD [Armatimonadota bacterium]
MTRHYWTLRGMLFACLLGLVACCQLPAAAQAYCYLREVKIAPVSNGVQIQVRADGILSWNWETGGSGNPVMQASIRFPSARLGLQKTLYNENREPVATVTLNVPQDAPDGRGVVMTVAMTQASRISANLSDDRQTLLLNVFSTYTSESRRPTEGGGTLQAGAYQVKAHDGLVNVQAVKANIHQVVAELARQCAFSVAIDDAVQHNISINFQDGQPLDVLRGIAAGYGLALSSVGDVYMLSEGVPADLPTYLRSGTASFPIKYLKAADARQLLPSFLFMYVHDNPLQNAVVVTAPSQMLEKIGRDLKVIDTPPAMVMIECAVVELSDSRDLDVGFRWQYQSRELSLGTDSNNGLVNFTRVNTGNGLTSAIVPTPLLQVWLQALITRGRAEVQAHPSMAAVNGKYAELFIGSQRFVKMTFVTNGVSQDRIETVQVGTLLRIAPSTSGGREITTGITVELSNIVQIDPKTGVPRVSKRSVGTNIRTMDGDTIVIGGLSQKQEEDTKRRIPVLGSLPLLGPLFQSKSKSQDTTELVVLIRPRLLDANGRLPEQEDLQLRNKFLQPGDPGCPPAGNPAK